MENKIELLDIDKKSQILFTIDDEFLSIRNPEIRIVLNGESVGWYILSISDALRLRDWINENIPDNAKNP